MSASSFHGCWRYDVFVSFRGEDVRKNFVDHLFKDFKQKGICAFRDDSELPKGEEISLELYKAIEESRFLLVIFSKDYASSSWCLRELVKILECKQRGEPKHEVGIVFYDIKPSVVRKQTESYAVAFANHKTLNRTEVAEWKEALTTAANFSGWDLEDLTNGYEAKFIDNISGEILKKLCVGPLDVGKNLVGVDNHVQNLNLLRFVGSNKVHMIGICGISGIGKTTLVKAIYNLLHVRFEGSCFCDVQEVLKREGLTGVQMQPVDDIMKTRDVKIYNVHQGIMVIRKMMSSKPILLVLDDVDNREQLEALASEPDWFFPGSIIIFTCKDKKLLRSHHVLMIYDMPLLPFHEAFELFRLHAFGQQHCTHDFEELTYQIVQHLQGHPLALKVLGGYLYKEPVNIWKSQLDSLQTRPHGDIQQKLRPSFDGLDIHQKRIFLYIACCFIGENRDFLVNVLNSSDYSAEMDIEVLVNRSLITISLDNKLVQMHELIQCMAREIVREEYNMPRNSRLLWGPLEEVYDVLSENKVTATTEVVEVIVLSLKKSSQKYCIHSKAFTHMKKLRILKICYQERENLGKPEDLNVNYIGSLDYLSNKLRLLYWHGFPFNFIPPNFYPENIVVIDLSYGHIKSLWTTPKCFSRLKIMKLKHCRNLISTPDFTGMTNLEELILEGCVNLIKVHPSIGVLESLLILNLSGCLKVNTLPGALGRIKSLVELYIHQTAITSLPSFVLSLTRLLKLSFGRHESFCSSGWSIISQPLFLPQSLVLSSLADFRYLRSLNLDDCNILQVPESIVGLSCLEELYMGGNDFTSLPESLSQLSCLRTLGLSDCKNLEVLPELPPSITHLYASDCNILQVPENIGALSCLEHLFLNGNNFTSLPGSLSQLSRLQYLQLDGCRKLEVLPELPRSIIILHAYDCPKLVWNVRAESEEGLSLETFITCHGSTDKLPSLLRYIDIHSNICEFFNAQKSFTIMEMMFHGNIIPEWFKNQSMGSEVKVELPRDWCYNKFKGYAICVVYTPNKSNSRIKFNVNNFDGACLDVTDSFYIKRSKDESIEIHESPIIWLYYSTPTWRLEEAKRWEEAKYFITFSFRGYENEEDVEVKKCGVRLVCDEEDLQQEMNSSLCTHYLPTPTQDAGYFNRADASGKNLIITW